VNFDPEVNFSGKLPHSILRIGNEKRPCLYLSIWFLLLWAGDNPIKDILPKKYLISPIIDDDVTLSFKLNLCIHEL